MPIKVFRKRLLDANVLNTILDIRHSNFAVNIPAEGPNFLRWPESSAAVHSTSDSRQSRSDYLTSQSTQKFDVYEAAAIWFTKSLTAFFLQGDWGQVLTFNFWAMVMSKRNYVFTPKSYKVKT